MLSSVFYLFIINLKQVKVRTNTEGTSDCLLFVTTDENLHRSCITRCH